MLTNLVLSAIVAAAAPSNTELTVYNDGYALVKSTLTLDLKKGLFQALVENVAQQIEANSVGIRSLGDKDAFTVLEQNYKYDLVNVNAILNKAVGSYIRIHSVLPNGKQDVVRGKLLSAPTAIVSDANGNQSQVYNGMVLQTDDGRILLDPTGTVEVEKIPEGMISKPSLVWTLDSNKEGRQDIELSYLTRGMSWKSDYVLSLDKEGRVGDLKGWVTMTNNSGTSFEGAKLKLLAGEVNRAPQQAPRGRAMAKSMMMDAAKAPSMNEETFGEYHLYTVTRPVNVENREIKQVSLLEASGIKVKKLLLVDSMWGTGIWYPSEGEVGTGPIKPAVYLEISNTKDNSMGMPLPAGTFKVFQTSSSGSLEMLGEDSIQHTPKDETLKLRVGKAFDIVAERKRLSFKKLAPNVVRETYSIELRNRKDTPEEVTVWERHWGDHTILEESEKGTWLDSQILQYKITLKPSEVHTIKYVIETRW